jgi:hypothetical protein
MSPFFWLEFGRFGEHSETRSGVEARFRSAVLVQQNGNGMPCNS